MPCMERSTRDAGHHSRFVHWVCFLPALHGRFWFGIDAGTCRHAVPIEDPSPGACRCVAADALPILDGDHSASGIAPLAVRTAMDGPLAIVGRAIADHAPGTRLRSTTTRRPRPATRSAAPEYQQNVRGGRQRRITAGGEYALPRNATGIRQDPDLATDGPEGHHSRGGQGGCRATTATSLHVSPSFAATGSQAMWPVWAVRNVHRAG